MIDEKYKELTPLAYKIAESTIGFEMGGIALTEEKTEDVEITKSIGINGELHITKKYKGHKFGWGDTDYTTEAYMTKLNKFIERTGITHLWWNGTYDFDDIEGERLVTQEDVDFLNKHGHEYKLEMFNGHSFCYEKCLMFKDGTILLEDKCHLAGRGYHCDYKNDAIKLDWFS